MYDPCCGSGGMFVQSLKFVDRHNGSRQKVSIIGQESVPDTWRLCKMNLAIRGIAHNLGETNASTFTNAQGIFCVSSVQGAVGQQEPGDAVIHIQLGEHM